MNLNAIRKRIEALEREAALRSGAFNSEDLLHPQDMVFLAMKRQRLGEEDTLESAVLISRIDDLLERHEKAARMSPQKKAMTPSEAVEAMREATERGDEEAEEYRRKWEARLGAEREVIREVISDVATLKG